jgi:Lsr2
MAIVFTRVDDLHKTEDGTDVPAEKTIAFSVEGVEYELDVTLAHAEEFRTQMKRYTEAATPADKVPGRRAVSQHPVAKGDTPLKSARRFRARMRAFADARPELGEKSYLTKSGNYSYTPRLVKAYDEYERQFGPYPLPDDPQ